MLKDAAPATVTVTLWVIVLGLWVGIPTNNKGNVGESVALLLIVRLLELALTETTEPTGIPVPLTASPTATSPNKALEVIVDDPAVVIDEIDFGPPNDNVEEPVAVALMLILMLLGVDLTVTTEPAGIPAPLTASPTTTGPNKAAEVIVGDPLVVVDKICFVLSNDNVNVGETVALLLIVRLLEDSLAVTTEPAGIPVPLTTSPTATVPNKAVEVIVGDPFVLIDESDC